MTDEVTMGDEAMREGVTGGGTLHGGVPREGVPRDGTLLETVRELAFPRYPGTDGERRAADAMAQHFEKLGLEVSREPFRASRTAVRRLRLSVHGATAAALLLLGLVAPADPRFGALVGVSLLLLVVGAGRWRRGVESGFDVGPMISSENIVGRRPGVGANPLRLVILAHLDSKSARLPTFWPSALVLGALAVALLLTVWSLLSVTRGWSPPPASLSVPLCGLGVVALLVSPFNPSGNESPGAMDNASGLAVLREAARTLPADPALEGTELVFLATGAEEIGLAGAMRWIQAHESELDRAHSVFVNIDSVGVGRGLVALNVRGYAPGGRSMGSVVRAAAGAAGVAVRVLPFLPGIGVDTMPIAARGYATVTLLGQVLGSASRRIHSSRDTIEYLTETGLADAVETVREIARTVTRSAPR